MSIDIRRCRHIKTNGIQCGSPALRGREYCHFHRQAFIDFPQRRAPKPGDQPALDLGLMDDPDAIHYALAKIAHALATGAIDPTTASRILYTLQIMSANFKQTSFYQQAQDEYKASNLNAYQMWDRMKLEDNDRKRKELFEKRKAELEKLERTCSKCGHECEHEEELSPKVPPMKEQWPEDPDIDDYAPQVTIKASEDTPNTEERRTQRKREDRVIWPSGDPVIENQKPNTDPRRIKSRTEKPGPASQFCPLLPPLPSLPLRSSWPLRPSRPLR